MVRPGAPEPALLPVQVHEVAPGETVYRIAHRYGISVEELERTNHLSDPRALKVGRRLVIPRPPQAPGPSRPEQPAHAVGQGKGVLDWPLRGVLYARFGRKGGQQHDGIDLAAPLGTPVRTAGPGKVLFAGAQHGYGNVVIIEHPGGLITVYAHNRDLEVKAGQTVKRHQVIATVGKSGLTSGPHLHFEVRRDTRPVDPLGLLGKVPSS